MHNKILWALKRNEFFLNCSEHFPEFSLCFLACNSSAGGGGGVSVTEREGEREREGGGVSSA